MMNLYWTFQTCIFPTLYQGALISVPLLSSALLIRFCVLWGKIHVDVLSVLISILGLFILWMFYAEGVIYFVFLCLLVYMVLQSTKVHRGAVVGIVCVLYLLAW